MKLRRQAESEMLLASRAALLAPAVRTHRSHAWTLIEMIGVMAVLAILAAILLPVWIKQIDKSVADQEKATLKSLADAFQQYVLSTRVIPDQTTWYAAVASKLGLGTDDVLYNVRQRTHLQQRVFLIDPALQASSALPYSQTNFLSGNVILSPTPMQPQNVRVMIVSSLGRVLPNTVVSGVFGDTNSNPYFANLWNWNDAGGTPPPGTPWNTWAGNPGDLVVQRINLTPLFVHLLMSSFNSPNRGAFAIDGTTPVAVNNVDGYFIQGSVVTLYTGSSPYTADTQHILARNSSFIIENGVWRGSLSGSSLSGGIMNIGDLVQQFLLAPPNVNAQNKNGNGQQVLVVSNMLSYMSNYNIWAQGGFTDANFKNKLIGIQADMVAKIQGLYKSPANAPANPSPCLQ